METAQPRLGFVLRFSLAVSLATFGCTGNLDNGGGGGTTGATAGSSGSAGTTGAAGATGAAGRGGTTGTAGTTGVAGATGAAGRGGTMGTAGTTGAAGAAGTTGAAGRGGSTGTAGSAAAGTTGSGGTGRGGGGGNSAGGSGGGSAGAAGTAGAAGSTGTGGTAAASCLDGKKNGTETGVDCGGSCAACPSYQINPPNLKNNAQSGCLGGTGFMCTRSMVFSPEFKQAAADDWQMSDPPFVYGAVGHDKDSGALDTNSGNTCCQCYQLVFTSPRDPVSGVATPKPMIVQAFNTAAGGAKNFDIYMAMGGYGSNSAGCPAMYSMVPSIGEPNNGGVRAQNLQQQCASSMGQFSATTVAAQMCQDAIGAQCAMIQSTSSATNQSTSQGSCIEANQPQNLYHMNWNVMAKRVECPTNLTRVTGCKLGSQGLPQADPTAKDQASATNGFMSGYSTTTMQDCCRPTCAYSTNVMMSGVSVDSQYGAFYTCDKSGNPS
jgi:hypothetical protein